MNFKDKIFTTSLLIVLGSVSGLLFPAFVTYIFILAGVAGVVGILYWYVKETRG